MTDHVDLLDPYIHETKGIASATSGQILVADGIGSGNWTSILAYGGLVINDDAGATEVNNIGTTAQKIAVFNDSMPSLLVVSDEITDSDLEVPFNGVYAVQFNTSASTVAAGDAGSYNVRLRINGSEGSTPNNIGVQRSFSGTGDLGAMSFFGFVNLSAGDLLTVWIESDNGGNTDDIAIYDMSFWTYLVRRT